MVEDARLRYWKEEIRKFDSLDVGVKVIRVELWKDKCIKRVIFVKSDKTRTGISTEAVLIDDTVLFEEIIKFLTEEMEYIEAINH